MKAENHRHHYQEMSFMALYIQLCVFKRKF